MEGKFILYQKMNHHQATVHVAAAMGSKVEESQPLPGLAE